MYDATSKNGKKKLGNPTEIALVNIGYNTLNK